MRVIGKEQIHVFTRKHRRAAKPLAEWVKKVEAAQWRHFADIRQTFNSADVVDTYVVFNISGNHYRLAALVVYANGVVTIEKIMTHAQYDSWSKKRG